MAEVDVLTLGRLASHWKKALKDSKYQATFITDKISLVCFFFFFKQQNQSDEKSKIIQKRHGLYNKNEDSVINIVQLS